VKGVEIPPPVTPEEADYFRRIEERFLALRGDPMLLSPRDWALISDWWSQGIPLSVVLESVEEVFAGRARRGERAARVNSLAYTRQEVLRGWALYREMVSSRRSEGAEASRLRQEVRRHLGRVARGLADTGAALRIRGQEELARTLLAVSAEVRAVRKAAAAESWSPSETERALELLDAEVLAAAEKTLGEKELAQLSKEEESILCLHQSEMKREALLETRAVMKRRLIRRRLGIPRISLLGEG